MTFDALSFVLDGLEDFLALERELGVEEVEVDPSLLEALKPSPKATKTPPPAPKVPPCPVAKASDRPASVTRTETPRSSHAPSATVDFAFIHDGPLSEKSVAMMGKIIVALGSDLDRSPIAIEKPLPKARLYIFLGQTTLRKFLPRVAVEENSWFRTPKGVEALLVKSPEEIVRFSTVSPALRKIKEDMWRALKTIRQHLV